MASIIRSSFYPHASDNQEAIRLFAEDSLEITAALIAMIAILALPGLVLLCLTDGQLTFVPYAILTSRYIFPIVKTVVFSSIVTTIVSNIWTEIYSFMYLEPYPRRSPFFSFLFDILP